MSYYQFNRQEILQRAKNKYCKEKAVEYYLRNKDAIDTYKDTKTCQKKKKTRLKSIKKKRKKRYQQLNQHKNEALQSI